MLRNSFLLNHDYFVHKTIVQKLTSNKFELLFDSEQTSKIIPLTLGASEAIVKACPRNNVSQTLITKILLGVFGCAPAYDKFFRDAAKKYGICSSQWGERSLQSLWHYYTHHQEAFEKLRYEISLDGFLYTPMKLMDMCLWQIGYDESQKVVFT